MQKQQRGEMHPPYADVESLKHVNSYGNKVYWVSIFMYGIAEAGRRGKHGEAEHLTESDKPNIWQMFPSASSLSSMHFPSISEVISAPYTAACPWFPKKIRKKKHDA